MARGYEQYKQYRPALTASQQKLLRASDTPEKLLWAHQEIAVEMAEKQFSDSGTVNVWDESGRKVRSDALPEDEDIAIRFPGVDPRGKYSALDMKFAQRREVILSTLAARSAAAGRTVRGDILESEAFRRLERRVDELACRQRILTRAEKLCISAEGAAALHVRARELNGDEAAVSMDKAMQGMEYLLGIRPGPLPTEIEAFYRDEMGFDLTAEWIAEGRRPVAPTELNISFPSFWNKAAQLQFAKPENWGKPPKEFVPLSPDEIGAQIEPYLRATAGRTLDLLFAQTEERSGPSARSTRRWCVDRGEHILIDGKTPCEILLERYRQEETEDYPDFKQYYAKNGRQLVTELVASALTSGRRVEAFLPDADGRIPDRPVLLTQTGFAPERFDPATLNCWERFWNKLGFYREKAAQAEADASRLAAYGRVRACNLSAKAEMDRLTGKAYHDMFFGDWIREHDMAQLPSESARHYSLTRSAWPTLATLKLLGDGYSLADIFDPDKLRAEKQAAGKLLIDKIARKSPDDQGDVAFEAELFYRGAAAFTRELDKLAEGLDLTDPATYSSDAMRPLRKAMLFGYDAFQEMERCMSDPCVEEKYGRAEYARLRDKLGDLGIFSVELAQIDHARQELLMGDFRGQESCVRTELVNYFVGAEAIRTACEAFGGKAGRTFSEAASTELPIKLQSLQIAVITSGDVDRLCTQYSASPEGREAVCGGIVSGKLGRSFRIAETARGPKLMNESWPEPKAGAPTGPSL